MMRDPTQPVVPHQRLRELLLSHLQAAQASRWPGADGLTVQEVLAGYAEYARAGWVPDLQELLCRHPELREALLGFFADACRPANDQNGGSP